MTPEALGVGVLRSAVLLVPVLFGAVLVLVTRTDHAGRDRASTDRLHAGAALATLWNATALLVVNATAVHAGWWTFGTEGASWSGVPIDVVFGWAVLWGAVPVLLGRWVRPWLTALVLVAADAVAMKGLAPMVVLGESWWWGEATAVAVALVPGLVLGQSTATGRALRTRVVLQVLLFAALLLFVVPTATFASTGTGWSERLAVVGGPVDLLLAQVALVAGVVALRSVAEFACHGGTPFPWDPPDRLVCTGPYAYVANPMQVCAVLILALGAVIVSEPWLAAVAVTGAVFGAGVASWHERAALRGRFGSAWLAYRRQVRDWLPRWRPTPLRPVGVLYPAAGCDPCSELGDWFARRGGTALRLVPAEDHPEPLVRLRYECPVTGESADGVRAVGHALEHLNLGWAVLGWLLRAPVLASLAQLVTDAVGGGPREIRSGAG
ncbi:methyltransferase family protein [Rhodococcus kronopolitis]|uniref:Methyltransferase family protein n=1 Tax=Rhodococcus kronopolitis TaxID=1460226 RepID=A0ABV9FV82_9NOCA